MILRCVGPHTQESLFASNAIPRAGERKILQKNPLGSKINKELISLFVQSACEAPGIFAHPSTDFHKRSLRF